MKEHIKNISLKIIYDFPFYILLPVAFYLRLYGLSSKGLWADEAYSVYVAHLPFIELIKKLSFDSSAPFYYLCLRFWINLFGFSEFSIRALSMFFSMVSVISLYVLTKKYFSKQTAFIATCLISVSPIHIYYAQEARNYSLLSFLGILLAIFSLNYLVHKRMSALLGTALTSILILWSHNAALWLVMGMNMAFFMLVRDRKLILKWVFAQIVVLIFYLPWFLALLIQVRFQEITLGWFMPFWNAKNIFMHFIDSINSFMFGPFPPYLAIQSFLKESGFIFVPVFLLMGLGLMKLKKSVPLRYMALSFLFTVLLSLIYSSWFQPVYISGRTDYYLSPFFLIMLALGIQKFEENRVKVFLILIYIGLALLILIPYYQNTEKNNSRTYFESIRKRVNKGDMVITTGDTYTVAEYYIKRWELPVYLDSFPLLAKSHPGSFNFKATAWPPELLKQDSEKLIRKSERILGYENKVFILSVPYQINSILINKFKEKFILVDDSRDSSYRQSLLKVPVRILIWKKN